MAEVTRTEGGARAGARRGAARIGFLHTVPSTIALVEAGMRRWLPGLEWLHIYDGRVREANFASPVGVTPRENLRRWSALAGELQEAGCSAIASCCSLMGEATSYAAAALDVPFVQLDDAVLDSAIERFSRIGVLITTPFTVPHARKRLVARADRAGKTIELVFGGDPRALDLAVAGEVERHDRAVETGVRELEAAGVECVLLAQIPLAALGPRLDGLGLGAPILRVGEEDFMALGRLAGEGSPR